MGIRLQDDQERKAFVMRTRRDAFQLMTVLTVMIGIVLILVFYNVQMHKLKQGSVQTLNEIVESDSEIDQGLPGYYVLYTGDSKKDLYDSEIKMIREYKAKGYGVDSGHVRTFKSGDILFYYIALDSKTEKSLEISGKGTPIIYVDVSFEKNLMDHTMVILSVVLGIASIILIIVGMCMSRMIKKNEDMKRTFFENASHELKTPLMAIEGYTEGIEKNVVDKDAGCRTIMRETERMSDLVNSILEMSKLDSGAAECNIKENDIREIIYDCVAAIGPKASEAGVRIDMDIPGPVFADCDEGKMYSAISNIIVNGIRYAKSYVKIAVDANKDDVRIVISNDGGSMTADEISHVFDRFYKGNKGQTGIGMALAKEYIELHGGHITVGSKDGCGFDIIIPRKPIRKK